LKRRALEAHLRSEGARRLDEGGNHTRWVGPTGRRSAVPRHREVDFGLARAICRQLGISPPSGPR
jgi:hypothetical protein